MIKDFILSNKQLFNLKLLLLNAISQTFLLPLQKMRDEETTTSTISYTNPGSR